MRRRSTLLAGLAMAAVFALSAAPARADWDGGYGHGWGEHGWGGHGWGGHGWGDHGGYGGGEPWHHHWHPRFFGYGARYYAPPPVYYAPPPVYYAPQPYYGQPDY